MRPTTPTSGRRTSTALASLRWLRQAGRFSLGASASYRNNFDRYDWTRGTAMNRHNTDNAGARLWTDLRLDRRVRPTLGGDYAFNHIYSTNLGEALSRAARPLHARQGPPVRATSGCATPSSGGASTSRPLRPASASRPTALRRCGASRAAVQPAAGQLAPRPSGRSQSMRLPTFTDLYSSCFPGADQQPRPDAGKVLSHTCIDSRLCEGPLECCRCSTYYRAGRDIYRLGVARGYGRQSGTPSRPAASTPTASKLTLAD